MVKQGILKTFNAVDYLATIQVIGSLSMWLSNVPVSRGIPSGEMVAGRTVYVLFADSTNPSAAMIVGVR